MEIVKNTVKDGWESVEQSGNIYWKFWDDGELITTVTEECRDNILQKSKLPLKLINYNSGLEDNFKFFNQ